MTRRLLLGTLLLVLGALLPSRARACGGCFSPPQTSFSQVTGHRMAFAVSPERTVLWDQFEYSGSPEEFSWVLPVARGAYLEEANQAWFDALDVATRVRVTGPALSCASSNGAGCACGAMSADASEAGSSGLATNNTVQVIDQRNVGPYEVVTLRTEQGQELFGWFEENGYFVPDDISPVVEAYVSEGYDFIAVKLRPGQGVQQMTPVRVITPGGQGLLPLRMVAAGVGDQVGIVLYVIGDARYQMPDLEEVTIDEDELVWDFSKAESNYARLRQAALSENGGFSFLTTFADSGVFSKSTPRPMQTSRGTFADSLADLYFAQAAESDGTASSCDVVQEGLQTSPVIVEDWDSRAPPASGSLVCGGYSDLATALVGLAPARAWLTRLDLELPKYALSMDCVVERNADQTQVDSDLTAARSKGRPEGCEQLVYTSGLAELPRLPPSLVWCALGVASAVALGRRRRTRTGKMSHPLGRMSRHG